MLSGDNSILQKATDAKQATETASAKEQIQLEVLGSYKTSDLELDKEKLKTNLEKIGATVADNDFPLTVTLNENVFTVKDDGTVENGFVEVKIAKFVDSLIGKTHGFETFSQITKIELATSAYAEQYKISTNLVSTEDSDYPIYMWNDNNVLYWYSEIEHPELPSNCNQIFAGYSMLQDASGIENWSTKNVTDMSNMFGGCYALTNLNLSNWDTSNISNMSGTFSGCCELTTLDLSSFDTSSVTNMNEMFSMYNIPSGKSSKLQKIIVSEKFSVTKVTDSTNMFRNCTVLKGGNNTAYDSTKTDKSMAHIDAIGNPGYFSSN